MPLTGTELRLACPYTIPRRIWGPRWIPYCRQTFTDLDLLCIDDDPTDANPAILVKYVARDTRVRMIPHGQNRGYTCSVNSGFDAAQGEIAANLRQRMKERGTK